MVVVILDCDPPRSFKAINTSLETSMASLNTGNFSELCRHFHRHQAICCPFSVKRV